MMRRFIIVLLYCLFILVASAVCLVLLFPRQQFLGWSAQIIEQKIPGIECTIGGVELHSAADETP